MGFETRFDYSCVGDTVNVASRLEGACKSVGYDILVTAGTRAGAAELAFLPAGAVALRGMSQREQVYLLLGDETLAANPSFAILASAHAELVHALGLRGTAEREVARCTALGSTIDPRLAAFYAACLSRRDDFALAIPAAG